MFKKIMLIFVSLVMCLCVVTQKVSASTNGQCGDNVYWSYDDGVLTISGEGDMKNYNSDASWSSYANTIKTIVIQDGVTTIGDLAFEGCSSLTCITIPNSVVSIGADAFADCYSLETIDIGNGVQTIGNYAFWNCKSLTDITIPNNVISIGDYVFWGCKSLTNITIPKGVTKLGNFLFNDCESLSKITVNSYNQNYKSDSKGVLYTKDMKTLIKCPTAIKESSYVIPKGVEYIEDNAFYNCKFLNNIILPETVVSIGNKSFYCFTGTFLFKGDAPEFKMNSLAYDLVDAYYPKGNLTWTEEKLDYHGAARIQWKDYDPVFPLIDVSDKQWYYSHIKEAYDLGLMTGATETLFKPNANMNRGMVAIVFHRMEGSEPIEYTPVFKDVPNKQYYTTSVLWMKAKGIINGYTDGTFKPLRNVSREEMATMIYNFAKYKGLNVKSNKDITYFNDFALITPYARVTIAWAVENGLMSGKDNGVRLDPLGHATRAECAKMLVQAYKVIYNK